MVEYPQRILHVDDDEFICEIVQKSLAGIDGLELESCTESRKGIELARSFSPDVILMDLKMPDLDGPAFLQTLRDSPETADIPAIFLTGFEEVTMIDLYRRLLVIGIIYKPFEPGKLVHTINGFWKNYREPDQECSA